MAIILSGSVHTASSSRTAQCLAPMNSVPATIRSVELKYLFGRINAEDFDFHNAPSKTNDRIRQFSLRARLEIARRGRTATASALDLPKMQANLAPERTFPVVAEPVL
ncbi:hypothetical protein, partial [Ralstonia solanacearum]